MQWGALLPDEPADEDQLGAHEEIARTIEEIIESQDGGGALALEGPWGSGKSTVVRLLRRRFDGEHRSVFAFDAWAHQGDPLRRSFLESLIEHLRTQGEEGWVDRELWKRNADQLAKRQKTVERSSSVLVRPVAIAAALGVLLIPLGGILLTRGLSPAHPDGTLTWLGSLLILTPILGVLGAALWTKKRKKWKDIDARFPAERRPSVFAPISGSGQTDEFSTTSEDADPTSIEFEACFNKLMREALAPEDRRLLLVLDNLDRVEPQAALQILATMQTFLSWREHDRKTWARRLWVLVPYDIEGIDRLWAASANDVGGGGSGDVGHQIGGSELAREALDKMFRVRLRVPPLVISDWHTYFVTALAEACPDLSASDREDVYRVYETGSSEVASPRELPTPRRLKQYVNQVVSLRVRWRDQFPLRHIAYFALCLRDGVALDKQLVSSPPIPPRVAYLLDGDAVDHLAAMWFGVPVDKARQLLIGPELVGALREHDLVQLANLAQLHGFAEVLASQPVETWWTDGADEICQAAESLADGGILDDPEHQAILLRFEYTLRTTRPLVLRTGRAGRGLALVSTASPLRLDPSTLFERLSDDDDADPVDNGRDRVDAVIAFLDALPVDASGPLINQRRVRLALTPTGFVDAAEYLAAASRPDYARVFAPRNSWSEIEEVLVPLATTEAAGRLAAIAPVIVAQAGGQAFENVITGAASCFGEEASPEQTQNLLAVLDGFGGLGNPSVSERITNGDVYHTFYTCRSEPQVSAFLAVLILRAQPALPAPPDNRSATAGHAELVARLQAPTRDEATAAFAAACANRIASTRDREVLLSVWDGGAALEWTRAMLNAIAERPEAAIILDPDTIISRWQPLCELLTEDHLESVLGVSLSDHGLAEAVARRSLDSAMAVVALYLLRWPRIPDAGRSVLHGWLTEELRKLDEQSWAESLSTNDQNVEVLLYLLREGISPNLGDVFERSLRDSYVALGTGQTAVEAHHIAGWSLLLNALESAARREAVLSGTLTRLAVATEPLGDRFFDLMGPSLGASAAVQDSDQLPEFITRTITGRNTAGIAWATELAGGHPPSLTQDTRQYLVSNVDAELGRLDEDAPEDVRGALGALREALAGTA